MGNPFGYNEAHWTIADEHAERRRLEDEAMRLFDQVNNGPAAPVIPRCLKCGKPINVVRLQGVEFLFDHGKEQFHHCLYVAPRRKRFNR